MSNNQNKLYALDPELHCFVDCPDERKTARCVRASFLILSGATDSKAMEAAKLADSKCDLGPIRFIGGLFDDEILCGADVDPKFL